uniref:Uncharacterized protein n=1 Tax=Caenorhabditis tropicalis TaxID=1561998 RepID=A0A1I7T2L7_9PELO
MIADGLKKDFIIENVKSISMQTRRRRRQHCFQQSLQLRCGWSDILRFKRIQKLIHRADFVITEMIFLASNAHMLGILSKVVLANSQILLDRACLTLNDTEIFGGNGSTTTPTACFSSSVCYSDCCSFMFLFQIEF